MSYFLRIIWLLLLLSVARGDGTRAVFPSQSDVQKFVKSGLSEKSLIAHFGQPMTRSKSPNGTSILNYLKIPEGIITKNSGPNYSGFEVTVSNGIVQNFEFIYSYDRVPVKPAN